VKHICGSRNTGTPEFVDRPRNLLLSTG